MVSNPVLVKLLPFLSEVSTFFLATLLAANLYGRLKGFSLVASEMKLPQLFFLASLIRCLYYSLLRLNCPI